MLNITASWSNLYQVPYLYCHFFNCLFLFKIFHASNFFDSAKKKNWNSKKKKVKEGITMQRIPLFNKQRPFRLSSTETSDSITKHPPHLHFLCSSEWGSGVMESILLHPLYFHYFLKINIFSSCWLTKSMMCQIIFSSASLIIDFFIFC